MLKARRLSHFNCLENSIPIEPISQRLARKAIKITRHSRCNMVMRSLLCSSRRNETTWYDPSHIEIDSQEVDRDNDEVGHRKTSVGRYPLLLDV